MDSVLLAIPNEGWIRTDLTHRVRSWASRVTLFDPQGLRPVSYAKNICMQAMLDGGFDYVFFVDSDTVPPEHALAALLEAKVPVISGIYRIMKRDADGTVKPVPIVTRLNAADEMKVVCEGRGVVPIDACGAGCMLVHRLVVEKTGPPWFETDDWGEPRYGSDFWFCKEVRKAGIQIYAHFGVVCTHRKEVDL